MGGRYEGSWFEGKYHGFGKFTWPANDPKLYYEGEWEEGCQHGQGTLVYKDGRTAEGKWRQGHYLGP